MPKLSDYTTARFVTAPTPTVTSEQVKAFREELELTQEAFAEEYCIPLSTLQEWEDGTSAPKLPAGPQ